ncbi:melatonin receptor [Branchiostoma belcheri]|nr:melatonin receptor [Branchiostoma belcheri]
MNDTLTDAGNGTLPPEWGTVFNSTTPVPNDTVLLPDWDANDVGTGVKVGSSILLVVLICGGTFGNCLIIGAVYATPSLRSVSNIFIVNLAVADLMVSSVVDTFNIVGVIDQNFLRDHPVVCELVGVVCVTSCICSLMSVANIGINRPSPPKSMTKAAQCARGHSNQRENIKEQSREKLLFVVKPHWHASVYTVRKTLVIVAAMWVYSFLFDLPLLLGWGQHSYDIKTMGCTYDRTHTFR